MASTDNEQVSGYGTSVQPDPQAAPLPSTAEGQIDWLQGFDTAKKTNDGEPQQKKRGPKPNATPALTKKQELNRLAQRTHRDRKDRYAKELEWRVERARESHFAQVREMDQLKNENGQLKDEKEQLKREIEEMAQLLRTHGIPHQSSLTRRSSKASSYYSMLPADTVPEASSTYSQTAADIPIQPSASFPAPTAPMWPSSHSESSNMASHASRPSATAVTPQTPVSSNPNAAQAPIGTAMTSTYEAPSTGPHRKVKEYGGIFRNYQVAINFVRQLEAICIDHKHLMITRGLDNTTQLSGHSLMMTCPPSGFYLKNPGDQYYHQMPNLPDAEVVYLIQTSYPTYDDEFGGGEMAPAQALEIIENHPRALEINLAEFQTLTVELYRYMMCYGTGAMLPYYALRQELEKLFARKDQHRARIFGTDDGLGGFDFNAPFELS
ncbi:MAG: hypothetical protein Q9208_002671 [Pyrenodesmia sp. 3 TL-2023]